MSIKNTSKVSIDRIKERGMKTVFMVAACVSVLAVLLICLFLFASGIPAIGEIGPTKFLFGTTWKPSNNLYGIFPMIVASIYVTGGAILVGVPIALFTSVFMARYCPKKIYRPLKSGIELMAGVPSIVYGFFGLVVMVPFIRNTFGGTGTSWLAASLLLGIMILPTIIGLSLIHIFRTGDLGYVDEEGFVYLTGRKKNLIITKNGENVSPEELENKIGEHRLVQEILVREKNGVIEAEIFPDYEYAKKKEITEIQSVLQEVVDDYNKTAPAHKRVYSLKVRETEFEKTPSKKIKRY